MPPHAIQTDWDVTRTQSPNDSLKEQKEEPEPVMEQVHSRQGVRFFEVVTFKEIIPLSELCEEGTIWYTVNDYADIRREMAMTIAKSASSDAPTLERDGYCMRGLESRTKFGGRRKKNNRAVALDAVWKTQRLQWKQKIENPAAIAAAYKPHSMHAKHAAMEIALRDQQFVQEQFEGEQTI